MALHVIIGAGPIGTSAATHLVDAGHRVRMVTRSGNGPDRPGVERIAADVTDVERLCRTADGAAAIYNCANPAGYHQWAALWPPMAAAMLTAAERTGAGLVTMGNLYGYGPVTVPMTEELPLAARTVKGRIRARMWLDALAAHRAGRVRATEARASDYIGAGAKSLFGDMIAPAIRAGKRVLAPTAFDLAHSVTYTDDAGRLLATLGTDDRSWGRPWHVPTAPPSTMGELARRYARILGLPEPRLATMPVAMLRLGALVNPAARGFLEMRYQFARPFVLDSTAAQETFGLKPTQLDDALSTMR